LHTRRDTQFSDPGQIIGREQRGVFDAEAARVGAPQARSPMA
jgi:hypothetical protein